MTNEWNEEPRSLGPLPIIEQVTGLVLAMAIYDLSLGCRVEPDLFSARPGEKPTVASFDTDDYADAIQQALDLVPKRFGEGNSICALAYQGFETTDDVKQRVILIRVFWNSGDEAIISVPWINDEDRLAWVGPVAISKAEGTPDLLALESAILTGLPLFPKGYRVWSELKHKPRPH